MQEMLYDRLAGDQGNYREDNSNNNNPLCNGPCHLADKSKNHKDNGNYDEQYSQDKNPVHSFPPVTSQFTLERFKSACLRFDFPNDTGTILCEGK
jgi:hypothetical protein